jgi:5-methylcytosine-specific restriction endonuclease McrA
MKSKIKRFFNSKQRTTLFLAAQGVCQICGEELIAGWHGDHIKAFSKDGETEVQNGQALCPKCNLRKGNKSDDFGNK